jgi:hypothetical protein
VEVRLLHLTAIVAAAVWLILATCTSQVLSAYAGDSEGGLMPEAKKKKPPPPPPDLNGCWDGTYEPSGTAEHGKLGFEIVQEEGRGTFSGGYAIQEFGEGSLGENLSPRTRSA